MSQNTLPGLNRGLAHSADSECNSYIHCLLTPLEGQVCSRGLSGICADLAPAPGDKGSGTVERRGPGEGLQNIKTVKALKSL